MELTLPLGNDEDTEVGYNTADLVCAACTTCVTCKPVKSKACVNVPTVL